MTEEERVPGPEPMPPRGAAGATERVQELLGAAEQTALGILQDAEAEAQRRIDEAAGKAGRLLEESTRLVSEFADELLRQTETVRRRADELKRAARELARDGVESATPATPATPAGISPSFTPRQVPAARAPQGETGSLVLRPAESERKRAR